MNFVARFEEIGGNLFRFDTRIYLGEYNLESDGECIASVIGKNPGSASPKITGHLAPLELEGDKLLPYVRNRFLAALNMIGKDPKPNTFVRIWNLFYLCNKNLAEAKQVYEQYESAGFCPTEHYPPPINWFVWGPSDAYLNPFKERFLSQNLSSSFFYDNRKKFMKTTMPKLLDSVKHTQGMPAYPVEEHLSNLL